MKVLCVIDFLSSGGAQRQLVNMAVAFKEKGYDVDFLVYYNHDFYSSLLQQHDIEVHLIRSTNHFDRILKIRRFIRNGNFNVVLSFLQTVNFICELSGFPYRKWRLIVGERSANPNILKSTKLKFYRFFHLFADHIVANSYQNISLVRQINPFLAAKKCHVVYNMIDHSIWCPSTSYVPLKNGFFNLVVLARYNLLKNPIGLIEAVNVLPDIYKRRLKVRWYGEVKKDEAFEQAILLTEEYGLQNCICLNTECKDVLPLIQEADCIGLFSFHEGMPNVVCEGMAVGKPIMCSNVSDIPRLLKNPKYYFNPHNIQEIKETIMYFMDLSDEELIEVGNENRRMSKVYFDHETVIDKYIQFMTK